MDYTSAISMLGIETSRVHKETNVDTEQRGLMFVANVEEKTIAEYSSTVKQWKSVVP
tara:strand:+ start:602 stop:772 length:171 start_codon:yes stop_codon:yes gene_type:complete